MGSQQDKTQKCGVEETNITKTKNKKKITSVNRLRKRGSKINVGGT